MSLLAFYKPCLLPENIIFILDFPYNVYNIVTLSNILRCIHFGTLQIYYYAFMFPCSSGWTWGCCPFFPNADDNVMSILRSTCTGKHLSRSELPNLTVAYWQTEHGGQSSFPFWDGQAEPGKPELLGLGPLAASDYIHLLWCALERASVSLSNV